MKILVTSPTSTIGRRVLAELLAPEFFVRVLTNHPGNLPGNASNQIEIVRGSIEDPSAVFTAMNGMESMFWCPAYPGARAIQTLGWEERTAGGISNAIRDAGIRRIVAIHQNGGTPASSAAPVAQSNVMERHLDASGAAIRHVHCGPCEETLPWLGDVPFPFVSADDIADVVLKWLVRRDWRGIERVHVHDGVIPNRSPVRIRQYPRVAPMPRSG